MSLLRRFLVAVSFILAVLCANLMVRSYWLGDGLYCQYEWVTDGKMHTLGCEALTGCGGAGITLISHNHLTNVAEGEGLEVRHGDGLAYKPHPQQDEPVSWKGFGVRSRSGQFSLRLPLWLLLILLSLPSVGSRLQRWRERRRQLAAGLCIICGYDLRASRERCPECGTPIAAGQAAVRASELPGNKPT